MRARGSTFLAIYGGRVRLIWRDFAFRVVFLLKNRAQVVVVGEKYIKFG